MKNYYTARITVTCCVADIRIDDVPLFRKKTDAEISCEIPCNYLIECCGLHSLSLALFQDSKSVTNNHAHGSVEIWLYDNSLDGLVPIEQICTIIIPEQDNKIPLPVQTTSKYFQADVPYNILRWSQCLDLSSIGSLHDIAIHYYSHIGQILQSGNYEEYKKHIIEREQNIVHSLYLDAQEIDLRYSILIEHLRNDMTLQPINQSNTFLQYYAKKRLISLIRPDMRSALRFVNEKTGDAIAIDLLLGIKENECRLSII